MVYKAEFFKKTINLNIMRGIYTLSTRAWYIIVTCSDFNITWVLFCIQHKYYWGKYCSWVSWRIQENTSCFHKIEIRNANPLKLFLLYFKYIFYYIYYWILKYIYASAIAGVYDVILMGFFFWINIFFDT